MRNLIGCIFVVACLLLLLLVAVGPPPHPLIWAAICGVAGIICFLPFGPWRNAS